MKKLLSILCAAALTLSLAACGSSATENYAGQTLTGQVTAIDGSAVTLQLGELAEDTNTPPDGGSAPSGQAPDGGSGTNTPPEKPDDSSDSGTANGQPPAKPDDASGDANGTPPDMPSGGPGGSGRRAGAGGIAAAQPLPPHRDIELQFPHVCPPFDAKRPSSRLRRALIPGYTAPLHLRATQLPLCSGSPGLRFLLRRAFSAPLGQWLVHLRPRLQEGKDCAGVPPASPFCGTAATACALNSPPL